LNEVEDITHEVAKKKADGDSDSDSDDDYISVVNKEAENKTD